MANELRFIETLDSSNFDKGIADSSAAVRKIAEDANLASKGLAGMFDSAAFRDAAANFQGVEKAVQRFTSAMRRDLPIKQELRETQLASQELERAWRALSVEEKRTAAGRELRSKIDELIARGGALRDTMGDVQAAIRFNASDTASLDAVVGGIQAMTAAAQVGAGAMQLLGMSQEDAAKVQADLMAIMSVVNGLQVIQNSLTRESALMQGIVAVQTKAAAVATSLKAATSKADTIATKAATAAQWAWNAAIAANPIGALIVVVGAATAAIYALTRQESEAQKQQEALSDALRNQSSTLANNIVQLRNLQTQWSQLTGDKEKEQWVRDNENAFRSLGVEVRNTAEAENVLVRNTDTFIKAMQLRAKAAAYAAIAQKQMQDAIEKRQQAQDRRTNPSAWDQFKSGVTPWSKTDAYDYANNAASALESAADAAEKAAEESIRSMAELESEAFGMMDRVGMHAKSLRTTTAATRRTTGSRSTSTTTPKATKEPTPEGSWAWYDEQIKLLNDLAAKQADVDERNRLLAKAAQLENVKLAKFEGVKGGVKELNDKLNEQLSKVKIKIPPIDLNYTTPEEDAAEKAQALLDKTQGLRTAAQAAASAFRSMGDAIGGNAGKMVSVAGMLAQAIVTMIQGYATATAQAASLGPWAWAAFGLTGLAQLMAMISAVKSAGAFANGGFVGGSSWSGDRKFIRVNSGELVLNTAQQARLWNAINGGDITAAGQVQFKISGSNLVGVLRNYNNKTSKIQ